jgi:hypothetical protein
MLLAIALAALAAPASSSGPPAADVTVRIRPASRPAPESVRRAEIFRILQGGAVSSDAAVSAHLWQVACSLAEQNWTPPRVTVRTVDR